MKEIKGKNTTAKVFTDNIEKEAIKQIENMLDSEITKNTTVRIMPDVHAGKGAVIGTTIKLPEDKKLWKITPDLVGVDLGCGVTIAKIHTKDIDFKKLDKVIKNKIPHGKNVHESPVNLEESVAILTQGLNTPLSEEQLEYILMSFGTLGGGNHFIEVGKDSRDNFWIAVHSGSRNLGVQVHKYHQKIADTNSPDFIDTKKVISEMKKQGRTSEIENTLEEVYKKNREILESYQKGLTHLTKNHLDDYLHDVKKAQEFAKGSRKEILNIIANSMGWFYPETIDSPHNYIDLYHNVLRKGATSSLKYEKVIIPINMKDGILLGIGKGNADWNVSAPHGAGRILSRTKAFEKLSFEKYQEQMRGIYTTSVVPETLDEAPDVYKSLEEIIENTKETVEIIEHIQPVYNFKAH